LDRATDGEQYTQSLRKTTLPSLVVARQMLAWVSFSVAESRITPASTALPASKQPEHQLCETILTSDSNVASYEVVTASGMILNVTSTSFPDLYWALRGGGNNFGVVTKFNLETVPQGDLMWGGTRVHMTPDYPALIDAFATMVESAESDKKTAQILPFAVTAGRAAAQLQLEYLEPVNEADPPAVLKQYLSIPAVKTATINRTLASDTDMLTHRCPAVTATPSGRARLSLIGIS
jgi:hypothetical protein